MSAESKQHNIPWFLWPFWIVWSLVVGIVALTGRVLAVVLGLVIMILGVLLSITVIGALLGVPLFIVGAMLVYRGLF